MTEAPKVAPLPSKGRGKLVAWSFCVGLLVIGCYLTNVCFVQRPDFPLAVWVGPAGQGNFVASGAPRRIDLLILHTTETSAVSAERIFYTPRRGVSAHYLLTGKGEVKQFVRERDIAYHAGNWDYNARSIGIELEGWADGFVSKNGEKISFSWQTREQRKALTGLIQWLCERHHIPKDRAHIIGHNQVPSGGGKSATAISWGGKSQHHDPGAWWNWTELMRLLGREPVYQVVEVKETTPVVTMPHGDAPRIYVAQPGQRLVKYAEHVGFMLVLLTGPTDAQPPKAAGEYHWDGWIRTTAVQIDPVASQAMLTGASLTTSAVRARPSATDDSPVVANAIVGKRYVAVRVDEGDQAGWIEVHLSGSTERRTGWLPTNSGQIQIIPPKSKAE